METQKKNWRDLYPFRSRYFKLKSGHKIHYVDEGEKQAPLVLMVHGNPTWSFYFRNLITYMKGLSFRAVAFDHLGMGLSDRLPLDAEALTLKDRIAHTEELLSHLRPAGGKFTLVGHDWGGAIAMGVAVERPARVRSVVLFNTGAFTSKRIPFRINICRGKRLGRFLVENLNGFLLASFLMAVKKPMSSQVVRGYLYPYNKKDRRRAIHQFIQDIPMDPAHPSWDTLKHIENHLGSLKCPVMLAFGGADFCFNREFYDRFRDYFPKAQAHYLPHASHYVLEDAFEELKGKLSKFFTPQLQELPLPSSREEEAKL